MEQLGPYRIVESLAEGSAANVYAAVRRGVAGFAQHVAIKVLRDEVAGSVLHSRALLQEARAGARIAHPNVAQVHDLAEVDGQSVLVMELIKGWTVRALLASLALTRRLAPIEISLAIVRDAAAGVHAIHEAGLLHRDLTPDNIMIGATGHAKVIDLGSAAWRLTEEVRFTPPLSPITAEYASPQMQARHHVDPRTDIYSLGAILHELCTGAVPASGDRASTRSTSVIVAPSSFRADLPPRLEEIIVHATKPAPDERFASSADLVDALDTLAFEDSYLATPSQVARWLTETFTGVTRPAATIDPHRNMGTTRIKIARIQLPRW